MFTMESRYASRIGLQKRNAEFVEAYRAFFHREYEVIHVLNDISVSIYNGEMVDYSNPNGAGKSSAVNILSGILVSNGEFLQIKEYLIRTGLSTRGNLEWCLVRIPKYDRMVLS